MKVNSTKNNKQRNFQFDQICIKKSITKSSTEAYSNKKSLLKFQMIETRKTKSPRIVRSHSCLFSLKAVSIEKFVSINS